MKFRLLLLLLVIAFSCLIKAQNIDPLYTNAYGVLDSMLIGTQPLNFQKAVFITENAYLENRLNEKAFSDVIHYYTSVCRGIIASGGIIYPEKDTLRAASQCAVFLFMTDSIPMATKEGTVIHTPFQYNFDDFAGKKAWSSMFVSTLMQTKKGNCHSLPYLYKMIMDELGQKVYLSLAPNHIYIKARNTRVGWYNIELTCGDFPTDAWLMASGYVHTDALRNGIYMDTLSQKQSVTLCLVDLAQGYQAKFGIQDGRFILKCCDTALFYFPNYINALLLKAETLTALYKKAAPKSKASNKLLADMNEIYARIHQLGYRRMPPDMYLNWLKSAGTQTTDYRMKSLIQHKRDM
jgi:hypothetical protein